MKSKNLSINHHIKFTKLMNSLNGSIKYKDFISVDNRENRFKRGDVEIILLSPNQKKLKKCIQSIKKQSTL